MDTSEEVITAWISLTSIIKNNRIMKEYGYNESITLNLVYQAYKKGEDIYLQEIIRKTKMLKSLTNRTINRLIEKGFVYRKKDANSNRQMICFVPAKENDYLVMHKSTLNKVNKILEILGEKDALDFIRISQKITNSYNELDL